MQDRWASASAATAKLAAAAAESGASLENDGRDKSRQSAMSTESVSMSSPSIGSIHSAVSALRRTTPKRETKTPNAKLRSAVNALRITTSHDQRWGEFDVLSRVQELQHLSNEKLRKHLQARGEEWEEGSNKSALVERLRDSLDAERLSLLSKEAELEAKHRAIADLEERGAVYSTGKNNLGQLGLGDLEDRCAFEVVPATRGRCILHISTSNDGITFATAKRHDVYVWGGGGRWTGPTGLCTSLPRTDEEEGFTTPQIVAKLNGEEIKETAVGSSHACAISKGGDLFVWGWGAAERGMLQREPKYVGASVVASTVTSGEKHACLIARDGQAFTFGLGANGRLGQGMGVEENVYSPKPLPVGVPNRIVRMVACGAEHTLICTQQETYSFGCGDGGRLGHGDDLTEKFEPCEITFFRGKHVLDVSAGTWHSAVVVHIPPLDNSGWLYTFGNGYQGQLGLGEICHSSSPALVEEFFDQGLSVKRVVCGSHHNAAVAQDGNLYTWGSNKHGALGRNITSVSSQQFTPRPGIVSEFGSMINRIGRGKPMSIACGREYTIVATHPYSGPSEQEALHLSAKQRLREAETKKALLAQRQEDAEKQERLRKENEEQSKVRFLTSRRKCRIDETCPGFVYDPAQPSMCRECGYSIVYHTEVEVESE